MAFASPSVIGSFITTQPVLSNPMLDRASSARACGGNRFLYPQRGRDGPMCLLYQCA